MRWPWMRRYPRTELEEAQRHHDEVVADDERVDDLEKRTNRIIRENNLAPIVMRALGLR